MEAVDLVGFFIWSFSIYRPVYCYELNHQSLFPYKFNITPIKGNKIYGITYCFNKTKKNT